MTVERMLRGTAGTVVLVSLALGWYMDARWFLLTALVGLSLLQSAFTNWCPMKTILEATGKFK